MENLLKISNKLIVLVTFLLMLSSFSVVYAESGEDMAIYLLLRGGINEK